VPFGFNPFLTLFRLPSFPPSSFSPSLPPLVTSMCQGVERGIQFLTAATLGNLSDCLGRRPILLSSLILNIVGTLVVVIRPVRRGGGRRVRGVAWWVCLCGCMCEGVCICVYTCAGGGVEVHIDMCAPPLGALWLPCASRHHLHLPPPPSFPPSFPPYPRSPPPSWPISSSTASVTQSLPCLMPSRGI